MLNKEYPGVWSIKKHIDITETLASEMNNLFKHKTFENNEVELNKLLNDNKNEILNIFSKCKKNSVEIEVNTALQCFDYLCYFLSHGCNHKAYSVSFSKEPLEPLMWAHYADGFQGCVVIFKGHPNNYINLALHPKAAYNQSCEFKEVFYNDNIEPQCILSNALDKNSNDFPFNKKNSFWEYEKEVRLMMYNSTHPIAIFAKKEEVNKHPKASIFYYNYKDILGVIFGPRCNKEYKYKIEYILAEHLFYNKSDDCFISVNTELSKHGGMKIVDGGILSYNSAQESPSLMKRMLNKDEVDKFLNENKF
ncbi:DUF2971 domain-containing protein [Providencia stuartii]|uniref:DUF2971 domain-containing protein n=1 Tax=Providencia stuartii TaxID=588 RepID=UPI0015D993AF